MKNRIFTYILIPLCLSFLLLSSCEKEFLDVIPKGVTIAKTANDFRQLLDAIDNDKGYPYSLSQTLAMADALSDDVSIDSTNWNKWTTTEMHFQELFTFKEFVWLYEMNDDNNWKMPYYVISLTSVILEEIDKVTDNIPLKNQLIAEAKVHRAYAYLTLVNCYAKAYNSATASNDPGVPIITQPAKLPSLKRSSVQDVYDYIIDDLTDGIENLPDDVDQYKHRPAKTSVYAILARVYLYMGDYEKALEYTDRSLQIRDNLYDLNTQYTGDFPYYTAITKISQMTDEEMLFLKTTIKGVLSNEYMFINASAFDQVYPGFSKVNSSYVNYDLRRTLWFSGWNSSTTNMTGNYLIYYGNSPTYRYGIDGTNADGANNIPITTGEMYVTRAECNARLGNLQPALNDINAVAAKRYKTGTYTAITLAQLGNSQAAVIDAVLKERRRELYGKELRLFDIKRLHLPMTHYLGSLRITVPADDPRFIFPIFYKYIELNPELEDNDRSTSGVTYQ
jgi:tetratricopeptide (TPR) repeat protein